MNLKVHDKECVSLEDFRILDSRVTELHAEVNGNEGALRPLSEEVINSSSYHKLLWALLLHDPAANPAEILDAAFNMAFSMGYLFRNLELERIKQGEEILNRAEAD